MKKILIMSMILLVLASCSSGDTDPATEKQTEAATYGNSDEEEIVESTFSFGDDDIIVYEAADIDRVEPITFSSIERRMRVYPDGRTANGMAIIKCSVAGESINRIVKSSGKSGASSENYVLTPVLIEKIYYKDDGAQINEGEIKYLEENFYYVTSETPELLEYYEEGTVISERYYPMKTGKNYLVYVQSYTDSVGGETVSALATVGEQEAVFCLDKTADVICPPPEYLDYDYEELRQEVLANYSNK